MASRSYVHGLQEALWNRAASLGREVPKQSRPHLAAGIKIQETRSTVLVIWCIAGAKAVITFTELKEETSCNKTPQSRQEVIIGSRQKINRILWKWP